ncbi:MAG: ABC transporter substrate-binding protein [Alphaproteobacteria bacterium]|nr:ABC transporter substrate-binding protein [Alphaproteobacteria bacterium]
MTRTHHIARRRLIGAGAAFGAALGAPAILRAQTRTLVTTGYGGLHEKWFRTAVIEPFEKQTGAKIQFKYGAAGEWLTSSIANKDDPEIDVPMLSLPVAMRAITLEGIFLDLDSARIPNAADVDPMFFDLYRRRAVGFNYGDFGICYRADKVGAAPKSWKDLWNPAHAGKLLLPDITAGAVLEVIVVSAMIHGGSETNLEPGWAALKQLKPGVLRFFKNNTEPVGLFERAEAQIGAWFSARSYAIKDSGVPLDYVVPAEGAPVGVLSFHIARNTKVRDLAYEFVNFALSKQAQETFANGVEYGPCNVKAELVGRAKERVPTAKQLLRIDWPKLQAQIPAMQQRWQREIVA